MIGGLYSPSTLLTILFLTPPSVGDVTEDPGSDPPIENLLRPLKLGVSDSLCKAASERPKPTRERHFLSAVPLLVQIWTVLDQTYTD